MVKYRIWDKESDIITPIGELLSPKQWIERYPAAGVAGTKWIVGDGVVNGGVMMEFSSTIEHYAKQGCDFSCCATDQDYLDAIADFEDAPRQAEPDANERVAAALEFQNALAMQDKGLSIEPAIAAKNWERGLWSAEQAVLAVGEETVSMGIVDAAQYNASAVKLGKAKIVEVIKQA